MTADWDCEQLALIRADMDIFTALKTGRREIGLVGRKNPSTLTWPTYVLPCRCRIALSMEIPMPTSAHLYTWQLLLEEEGYQSQKSVWNAIVRTPMVKSATLPQGADKDLYKRPFYLWIFGYFNFHSLSVTVKSYKTSNSFLAMEEI